MVRDQADHDAARGRTALSFWHIPPKGWKDIVGRVWSQIGRNNVPLLAAGVAFYGFLAFVPLLASVVLLYGLFANPVSVAQRVGSLDHFLPPDAAHVVAQQLASMTAAPQSRTALGLLGALALAIYGALRGATSVVSALNVACGQTETRSLLRILGLGLALTLGGILALIAAIVAVGAMTAFTSYLILPSFWGAALQALLWLAEALIVSVLISLVYRYGPDRRPAKWSWLAPGSLFASVGTFGGTFLLGVYISRFGHYNATYGALGAVVSFLMWLYVAAYVLLLGAELNAEMEHQTACDSTIGPERPTGLRGAHMADETAGLDASSV
jgi:membrane protein